MGSERWMNRIFSLKKKKLFLAVLGLRCCRQVFSSCSEQGAILFSLRWFLLLWNTSYRARSQLLWNMGLDALRHAGSSQTRDQTPVSCVGRWVLNHWTTREVLDEECFPCLNPSPVTCYLQVQTRVHIHLLGLLYQNTEWLKQQIIIFSLFWRMEIQGQGAGQAWFLLRPFSLTCK